MKFIPLFIDFCGRKVLFVGGGKVAERKLALFEGSNAIITVVAPKVTENIKKLAQNGKITILPRKATENDINSGYFIVYAASDDESANRQISQKCKALGILCNRCDNPNESDFINGAIATNGEVTVAITSGGVPTCSQAIKSRVEEILTPELAEAVNIAKEIRNKIKKSSKTNACKISETIKELLSEESLKRIKQGESEALKQEILECL